jgi:hypothetical protein
MAIFLIATPCSLLPVKYCIAAPKLSSGTTSKSASIPLFNLTNALDNPLPLISLTSGIFTK